MKIQSYESACLKFFEELIVATPIPSEFQPFVSDAMASGKYRSEEEVLSTALRLLQERERKLDALRGDLQVGIDELEGGKGILLVDEAAQKAFFDGAKARNRERLVWPANMTDSAEHKK